MEEQVQMNEKLRALLEKAKRDLKKKKGYGGS